MTTTIGESPAAADAVERFGLDLARYDQDDGALVVPTAIPGLVLRFELGQDTLTAEQMHMLTPIGIEADWDPAQVAVFLMLCAQRRLDPWNKQAYLLKIDGKYIRHTSIGGLLSKADETGEYRGTVGPFFAGPDLVWREAWLDGTTPPAVSKVGILRAGFDGPVWGVATFEEYAVTKEEWINDPDGGTYNGRPRRIPTGRRTPAANWRPARNGGKPGVMLEKCAKARALRDAFPDQCAGFYVAEETDKMRHEATSSTAEKAGEPVPDPDTSAELRRAEYDRAMAAASTANAGPFPMFARLGLDDEQARTRLLAELGEQAKILDRPLREVTAKWVALHHGEGPDRWPLRNLAQFVRKLRPIILERLRTTGREALADRYMAAPDVGTIEELFGQQPTVIEGVVVDAGPADKIGERA